MHGQQNIKTQKKVKTYCARPILSHDEVQKTNNFIPHIHWPPAEIWSKFNCPNIY